MEALAAGQVDDDDGVEAAFEVVTDVNESVRGGEWVGDCFVYTNGANRLNYLVGDQTYTVSHFDQPMYVLGYLPRDGRVYVCNKDVAAQSFALSVAVVEYQTLVLRGEMEAAAELLPDVPADQKAKIARFLEGQGEKELALEVATDDEHRFDLALALARLDIALEIARSTDVEHRWKTVGDAALSGWDLALAEECFTHSRDLGSLLLLYTATSNGEGLRKLQARAEDAGLHNVAFSCLWQLADVDGCIDLLLRTKRTAEAVLFTQTYKPSRAAEVAGTWKEGLEKDGKGKVAKIIGVPPDEELFPEWDDWLQIEKEGGRVGEEKLVDVEGTKDGAINGEDGEASRRYVYQATGLNAKKGRFTMMLCRAFGDNSL